MTFRDALVLLNQGRTIRRSSWRGDFLCFDVEREKPYIRRKTDFGLSRDYRFYLFCDEIMANDWEVVE